MSVVSVPHWLHCNRCKSMACHKGNDMSKFALTSCGHVICTDCLLQTGECCPVCNRRKLQAQRITALNANLRKLFIPLPTLMMNAWNKVREAVEYQGMHFTIASDILQTKITATSNAAEPGNGHRNFNNDIIALKSQVADIQEALLRIGDGKTAPVMASNSGSITEANDNEDDDVCSSVDIGEISRLDLSFSADAGGKRRPAREDLSFCAGELRKYMGTYQDVTRGGKQLNDSILGGLQQTNAPSCVNQAQNRSTACERDAVLRFCKTANAVGVNKGEVKHQSNRSLNMQTHSPVNTEPRASGPRKEIIVDCDVGRSSTKPWSSFSSHPVVIGTCRSDNSLLKKNSLHAAVTMCNEAMTHANVQSRRQSYIVEAQERNIDPIHHSVDRRSLSDSQETAAATNRTTARPSLTSAKSISTDKRTTRKIFALPQQREPWQPIVGKSQSMVISEQRNIQKPLRGNEHRFGGVDAVLNSKVSRKRHAMSSFGMGGLNGRSRDHIALIKAAGRELNPIPIAGIPAVASLDTHANSD